MIYWVVRIMMFYHVYNYVLDFLMTYHFTVKNVYNRIIQNSSIASDNFFYPFRKARILSW